MSRNVKTFVSLVVAHCLIDCYGGVWPIFKYIVGLDLWWAGLIASTTLFAGAALQPLFGIFADHGHQRRFVIFGTALTSLGMTMGTVGVYLDKLGTVTGYCLLFLILLLVRVGQAMYHPAGASLAGNLSSARRSTFVALFISIGMVGFAFSQGIFNLVHEATEGHTHWMLIPAALVVSLAIAWCQPQQEPKASRIAYRDVVRSLVSLSGDLVTLFFIQALISALSLGVVFLMPEFLAARGYPSWLIRGGGTAFWVLGAVILMVPAGHLADRVGRRTVLIFFNVMGLVFFYVLAASPVLPIPLFALLCLLAGGCIGTVNPLGVSLGQQMSPQHSSVISGVLMGLAWAAGSFSPSLLGYLAKQPNLGEAGALAVLGLAPVISLLLATMLPHDRVEKLVQESESTEVSRVAV